jgi:hypothetical protein
VPFNSAPYRGRVAAKYLGFSGPTIMKYARSGAIFRGEYVHSEAGELPPKK